MSNAVVTKNFKMVIAGEYAMAISNLEAGKAWGLVAEYESVETDNGVELYISLTGAEDIIDFVVNYGHLALDFCIANGFCAKDGADFIDIAEQFVVEPLV